MNARQCDQCRAILRDLDEAYSDAWTSSAQEFQGAWVATYRMIGGAEQDAARAEELLSNSRDPFRKFESESAGRGLRIRDAFLPKLQQEQQACHKDPAST